VGLAELGSSDLVAVLAADLPAVDGDVVGRLVTTAEADRDVDGAFVVDREGRAQPLLAVYRRAALDRALGAVGETRNRPVRSMLEWLRMARLVDAHAATDIDTPEDLARWRHGLAH
jgi:molybdopterin-guanine dinucleotide biosynthesis protein A